MNPICPICNYPIPDGCTYTTPDGAMFHTACFFTARPKTESMTTQEQAQTTPSNDPDLVTISVSLTGPRELIDDFRIQMDKAYSDLSDIIHEHPTTVRRQLSLTGDY